MDGGGVPHPTPTADPGLPHALRRRPGPGDGPGRPREGGSAAAAERDYDQPSAHRPATFWHLRAPSPPDPHCRRLSASSFPSLHSTVCFTVLTGRGWGRDRQRRPRDARGAPRRPGGSDVGIGVPDPAPPLSVSETNGRVSPTRAISSPCGPRFASRWGE